MSKLATAFAIVGLLVGVLAGYVWWGASAQRTQADLRDTRQRVETLERQLEEGRTASRGLEAQLKQLNARLADEEKDLKTTKEMNFKLQAMLGRGKK